MAASLRPPANANLISQLLAASLAYLSARELVQILPVSRRFHSLTVRALYRRLVEASSLPYNQLILECYHPSAKLTTPSLSCRHMGTKLAGRLGGTEERPHLSDFQKMYSSFRPVLPEEGQSRRQRRTKGDSTATQDIFFDESELFAQLCATTSVAKESRRRGFFLSHVNTCDGVVRVWRQWLAERASFSDEDLDEGGVDYDRYLWVDAARNVGIRFRVTLGPAETMPLISVPGDDTPVSYTLIYEGEW